MSLPPDPAAVFAHALADHLAVINALAEQQSILEHMAQEMTRAIGGG